MADERIITLSEEDVIILKEVIAEVMRMRENPTLRTAQPIEDGGYGASPSTLKAVAMETGTGYIRFDVMQDVRGATIRANQIISANAIMPVTAGNTYFLQRDARGAWGVSYGQVTIQNNGALVGTEPIINFIGASSITDDPTNTRVTVTISSGGGSLEIKDVTGTPDYTSTATLVINITGSTLSQPSSGVAEITLLAASASQTGVVTTTTQTFAGDKSFSGGIIGGSGDIWVTDALPLGTHAYGAFEYLNFNGSVSVGAYTSGNALRTVIKLIPDAAGGGYHVTFTAKTDAGSNVNTTLATIDSGGGPNIGQWGIDRAGNTVSGGLVTNFGTKPTVTGSRASGAALVSLLSALSGLGMITDSTTL